MVRVVGFAQGLCGLKKNASRENPRKSGMFRICTMKEPTANLKQIIGWVEIHMGGTNFGSFSGDLPSYHPGSPKWLDLHRFEVQRGDTSQARTKKGAGLEIADGKPTCFQDRYLRWIKKKSWVFIRFLFFFFWKIRFQFLDCFFQMCQIVTRLPFKNPRYSDDLSSSMKLPDLRDRCRMAVQHASISNCWSSCVWVELDKLLTTWEFNNPIHGDSDDWTQEVVKVPWLLKWGMCPYSFHKPWGVVILLGPQRHRRHRPCAVRSMLTWLQLR